MKRDISLDWIVYLLVIFVFCIFLSLGGIFLDTLDDLKPTVQKSMKYLGLK